MALEIGKEMMKEKMAKLFKQKPKLDEIKLQISRHWSAFGELQRPDGEQTRPRTTWYDSTIRYHMGLERDIIKAINGIKAQAEADEDDYFRHSESVTLVIMDWTTTCQQTFALLFKENVRGRLTFSIRRISEQMTYMYTTFQSITARHGCLYEIVNRRIRVSDTPIDWSENQFSG